ncbi:DUF3291 domain-containing protein [Nocardia sp. ET3-3]|uniref:DUF3291 domain-containing protein n=1 Tax=Nocardia terrae TaxID=2675851 RepID=A0A7K1UU13_9NOCA|nr:DUF3291 domain-containing protein [Nocardia terrae]MVU77847.1 DUF3291 domain-containing protein [Nocardia terrae]
MHLAQLNIGRMVAPEGDPRVAEFFAALDEINAVADSSPGFVWRMVDGESNNATSLRHDSDPDMLVNMSVWESREALFDYVYRSGHMDYVRRRREWFIPLREVFTVLWWLPEGELPTLDDAMRRLAHLRENGPTPYAFTFRQSFEPEVPESVL